MSGTTKLLIGLAVLFALVLLTNAIKHTAIENELADKTRAALSAEGIDWASVDVSGRNATLSGTPPSAEAGAAALDIVGDQFGVHSAQADFAALEAVSPFLWLATHKNDTLTLSGVVPSKEALDGIVARAKAKFPNAKLTNDLRIAAGAPDGDWTSIARQGLDELAMLDAGSARLVDTDLTVAGTTSKPDLGEAMEERLSGLAAPYSGRQVITVNVPPAVTEPPAAPEPNAPAAPAPVIVPPEAQKEIDMCQSRIDEIMTGQTINFRTGSAEVIPQPNPLIQALSGVAKECPRSRIVISGHTDSVGDPEANQILSKARAQAVVNLLVDESVEKDQLTAQGFGASQPVADNTTPEGRSANRRIEFQVLYAGAP